MGIHVPTTVGEDPDFGLESCALPDLDVETYALAIAD